MTVMELVKDLEEKLDLPPEYHGAVERLVPPLMEDLAQRGVTFDEHGSLGVVSHLMALVKRMETGERVKSLGDDVLDQLDEGSIEIARQVLRPLEEAYAMTLDQSELALVTIHVQTALMKLGKA